MLNKLINNIKSIKISNIIKVCFFCRKKGHSVANCKERLKTEGENDNKNTSIICFRCGSNEHTLKNCKVPVKKGGKIIFYIMI